MTTTSTPTHRTAAQIAASLGQAAAALRDHLGVDRQPLDSAASWQRATRAIDIAMAVDGITAAQIATAAGVRQLVVAQHITDPRRRAAALAAARHDADRYAEQVRDAMRQEALWRMHEAGGDRGAKARIAADLGITRPTLDTWITEHEGRQP